VKRKTAATNQATDAIPLYNSIFDNPDFRDIYGSDTPWPLANYPDAVTLARLVAQPRFHGKSDKEAIKAALSLLHDCQTAILVDRANWRRVEGGICYIKSVRLPKKWPATFDDFCKLIVRARDTKENWHRLREYCKEQETVLRSMGRTTRECRADALFEDWKGVTFENAHQWFHSAAGYLGWWERSLRDNRRRAGAIRQQRHRQKKKKKTV
jgi:hypothetical protein